ncbi:uncharacterized protein LOC128681335 [Plodia interpunctella]|uniref:uncharacterized protein LOC128681335 n=1 Tax=Plodia interpunctella TaxID=58824 RepID=UPI0023675AE3|nr:uncharacterized protein LOC128681335 [Plodia interpunctella]
MSFDVNWDIDKYKEEHESDDHWQLRRIFMEKWKNNYSEERLVCLAKVFANIEFMGCRYPTEVMQEVSRLSQEVAQQYRNSKRGKLQRTFVSASDAAEDRAKGIKRQGGVVIDTPPAKSSKIQFVPQGQSVETENTNEIVISDDEKEKDKSHDKNGEEHEKKTSEMADPNEYLKDMEQIKCLDVRLFKERMFHTNFGRLVLLIRPWASKLWNIQTSCQVCGVNLQNSYENNLFKLTINGILLAQATGPTKQEAKSIVEIMAWNRLKEDVISILVKEQWIAHGDSRISVSDVTGKRDDFGTPVENSVATKMMKLMGWKGGGLGADAQGIAEPIKPNLQMVNRAGLGSMASDIKQLRRAGQNLMQRYLASDTLDLDLVFSSEFTKDERATLHQIAQRAGLASRSYGDKDRFLVVKKKLDPFSLARAVIDKGGCTPKYQVFIPVSLVTQQRR